MAAYTVAYEQSAPTKCIVIADTPNGQHCVATCDDTELARRATQEELIGTTVNVDGARFEG